MGDSSQDITAELSGSPQPTPPFPQEETEAHAGVGPPLPTTGEADSFLALEEPQAVRKPHGSTVTMSKVL